MTGSALWDAGLALAAHLEGALRDRTSLSVLEIGAGVGAAGLALAAGGHDVLLTDFAPEVLGLLEAIAGADAAPVAGDGGADRRQRGEARERNDPKSGLASLYSFLPDLATNLFHF